MSESIQAFVERLQAHFANAHVEVAAPRGEVGITFAPADYLAGAQALRDTFGFEMLVDLCGVDHLGYGSDEWDTNVSSEGFSRGVEGRNVGRFAYGGVPSAEAGNHEVPLAQPAAAQRFESVAQLLSVQHNRRLRLSVFAASEDFPVVPSVCSIWAGANWFEREAFDMFGIVYDGHPDLRRILTDYGFIGHPFRKDFPLTGNVEVRYDPTRKRVVYEPVISVEPRVGVARVVRDDARFATAQGEAAQRAGGQ